VASVFSFYRRGSDPTRLDRIYLPPLLESRPRVARYLPCTSDHHAFFLRLETAGLAVLPSLASKKSASLYWKLNSSVLKEQSFLPAFRRMWTPLAASRPPPDEAASQTATTPVTPTPPATLVTPTPPPTQTQPHQQPAHGLQTSPARQYPPPSSRLDPDPGHPSTDLPFLPSTGPPMLIPTFPPFTPTYHPPPLSQAAT